MEDEIPTCMTVQIPERSRQARAHRASASDRSDCVSPGGELAACRHATALAAGHTQDAGPSLGRAAQGKLLKHSKSVGCLRRIAARKASPFMSRGNLLS